MPKQPSEATQIRSLKREVKDLHTKWLNAARERDKLADLAAKHAKETVEWKDRFDTLLRAARINVSDEKKP